MLKSTLRIMDAIVGKLLASLIREPLNRILSVNKRIFIIRPGGIGDAVLLAPAINQLKSHNPNANITVLAERRNREVFLLMPDVGQVLCYDIPSEFFRALKGKYDVVIDTEQWYRLSAVVARMLRASIKIGFGTNERRRLFTHVVEYDNSAYETENFFSLIKPLEGGTCIENMHETMTLPSQAIARGDKVLKEVAQQPFVVIFTGASIKEKCWGASKFRQVAERVYEAGYCIVAVGGQKEQSDGAIISKGLGENLAGLTTLQETAAVVAKSSLLISSDSGILHIAALLGIPTVSLFGPSSVEKWAPKGDQHIALTKRLPCSPCSRYGTIPACPYKVRCMTEITPDEVISAAKQLLKVN